MSVLNSFIVVVKFAQRSHHLIVLSILKLIYQEDQAIADKAEEQGLLYTLALFQLIPSTCPDCPGLVLNQTVPHATDFT